jgi:hypothetical protein
MPGDEPVDPSQGESASASGAASASASGGAPAARPLSPKERALLVEKLRARDAGTVLDALAEVSAHRAVELTDAVVAQLSEARVAKMPQVVIEALKTLGDLGSATELDRAERQLPDSYGGWIAVARQRLTVSR